MIFNTQNTDELLKKVNKLFFVSLLVQIILISLLYLLTTNKQQFFINNIEAVIYLQYLMIFVTLLIIPGSEYLLKQKLNKIIQLPDKDEKIQQYLTSIIVKLGLVEFGSIISAVLYYLSGDQTFLYIAVILTLFFLLSKPGKHKIYTDLNIQDS